ncbi:hypothetical protein MKX01_031686 [Papaver californicum]|nr:hypothetical protein MKX01_031686 [Papaver californicum]
MRVGYVGTDYKGLQIQRQETWAMTIEGELEKAIFKAGGIRESDPWGITLAKYVNSNLPDNVKVFQYFTFANVKMAFSFVGFALKFIALLKPMCTDIALFRSFDARRECTIRKYTYLLPVEVIGIKSDCSSAEIDHHLTEFNSILNSFEGEHPFHNYTIRSQYRTQPPGGKVAKTRRTKSPNKVSGCNSEKIDIVEKGVVDGVTTSDCATDNLLISSNSKDSDEQSDNIVENSEDVLQNPGFVQPIRARWLLEPDEIDKIGAAHFRKIHVCSGGKSFMLLPWDIIGLSLNKFTRSVLPIAPSEVLILRGNQFTVINRNGNATRPEMKTLVEFEEILKGVDKFYKYQLLPQLSQFLEPSQAPWTESVESLMPTQAFQIQKWKTSEMLGEHGSRLSGGSD